jgi:hypothetical protein
MALFLPHKAGVQECPGMVCQRSSTIKMLPCVDGVLERDNVVRRVGPHDARENVSMQVRISTSLTKAFPV